LGGVYSALGLEAIGEAKAEQGFVILGGGMCMQRLWQEEEIGR